MDVFEAYAKHKERYLKTSKDNLLEYYANSYTYGTVCTFSGKADKAIVIFNAVLNIEDKQNIVPLIAKVTCHHCLAYAYAYEGDVDKAYENFMFVYNVNPNLLETSYCFLFKILEFKNDAQQIVDIVSRNVNISFGLTKLILEYYKLKHINKVQDKDLCKFIIKNFKYSNVKSKTCFDFFEKEIFELADRSKLYRQYFEFIGDMHKNKHFKLAIDDSPFI